MSLLLFRMSFIVDKTERGARVKRKKSTSHAKFNARDGEQKRRERVAFTLRPRS